MLARLWHQRHRLAWHDTSVGQGTLSGMKTLRKLPLRALLQVWEAFSWSQFSMSLTVVLVQIVYWLLHMHFWRHLHHGCC
mmetsp:Transcript_48622/g.135868  ORF Transcript_48622/g.135868 Transcript_48622/m.135868 type:complete len:80 (-) Transcript_48622:413-652(-)